MIHIFRQHQRIMMLVIAILTIIAFIFFYNPEKPGTFTSSTVATIYGRSLTQADIDREIRNFQLALALQQFDLIGELGGMEQDEDRALNEFVWNLLVLQHQARELGIEPTDPQVAARIKSLPVLQTSGQFDPRKYALFVQEQLGPRGMTERQLENVIRDSLRLEQLKAVIGAPVSVSAAEVREAARVWQKMDIQLVRFPLTAAETAVEVTEAEAMAFFERNKQTMLAPETRIVEFVEFVPPATEKPLEGKDRMDALQTQADAASRFAEEAAGSSFTKAAEAAGLPVKVSPEFDRAGTARVPAPELAETLQGIAPGAFLLTESAPISDVLQAGDKFVVVRLTKVNPQRPLTFEEVRPAIEKRVRSLKAEAVLRQNANDALGKIRAAVAGGKSFADAVAAAGLAVESLNGISADSGMIPPDQMAVVTTALVMEPGQVSGFLPSPDGGAAVFLASRAAEDASEKAKSEGIESGILDSKRRMIFLTWLASAREAAKIAMAPSGR